MFARLTTFEGARDRVDELAAFARDEVSPVVNVIPDCLGVELMVDRDRGRAVVINLYTTEEGRTAGDAALAPMREKAASLIQGSGHTEHLDVALIESRRRDRPGHFVRITHLRTAPEVVEDSIADARGQVLPAIRTVPGFGGAVALVDRVQGTAMMCTSWDDRTSLESSRAAADRIRSGSVGRTGAQVLDVEDFEVAYADIRSPSAHEETIRRLYAAMGAGGDLDTLDELLTEDIVDHDAMPGAPPGRAGVKAQMREYRAAFPDMNLRIDQYLEQGDWCAVLARASGTNTGSLRGMPATGRRAEFRVIDILRFEDGKCAEHWGLSDNMGMLSQLGLVTIPGGGPAAATSG